MRTLAIGDIHGCYRPLKLLEAMVKMSPDDQIITLGDHVDRGPDTRRVLQWLIDRSDWSLVALRGNHEIMMLEAINNNECHDKWLACGGETVLEAYGVDHVSSIPQQHLEFLEQRLVRFHIGRDHFYVHANARPELDLKEQPDEVLHWDTTVRRAAHRSGRIMICGHTPQRSGVPLDMKHAICIDTAACKGGWLTCLDVDTRYCWQANQDGETRSFWLDDGPDK